MADTAAAVMTHNVISVRPDAGIPEVAATLAKHNISAAPVVDASGAVVAVHQNHDYGHHPQGKAGVWGGQEAGANYRLTGGWRHLRTIADASEVLGTEGLRVNGARHWSAVKRHVRQAGRMVYYNVWNPVWFFFLGITRPVRNMLGWRSEALRRSRD